MNNLILATIVTAAIFTSAVIMSAVQTPRAYAQDHCSSQQFPSTGGHNTATSSSTSCFPPGPGSTQLAQTLKQQCQSLGDAKCSSSQTGFGAFGNDFKPHP
jgi:hypothetical protein